MRIINTEYAPDAIGAYSQAVVTSGLVFCSGQIAIDRETNAMSEQDITGQTALVLSNLEAVLLAAGASLRTVVKTTVYLANLDDFAEMNAVYAQVFDDSRPARATVGVSQLPRGALVEIDAIAVVR